MKYSYNLTVDIHDVDHNGIARCSSLMRYMQTAAQSQLTENHMSFDELRSMKRAFILSRIKMEFSKPIRTYAPLCAVSYPCESRGYSFLRCHSLSIDGEIVARAVSVWALIDTELRSLVKVRDFELGLTTYEQDLLALSRFSIPTTLTEAGTYTVNYSDLDQNLHMNNTRYPDMYANFLPLDGERIRSISISYQNEARRGERLRVFSAYGGDGVYYFRTVREDGAINTECEIVLEKI